LEAKTFVEIKKKAMARYFKSHIWRLKPLDLLASEGFIEYFKSHIWRLKPNVDIIFANLCKSLNPIFGG